MSAVQKLLIGRVCGVQMYEECMNIYSVYKGECDRLVVRLTLLFITRLKGARFHF